MGSHTHLHEDPWALRGREGDVVHEVGDVPEGGGHTWVWGHSSAQRPPHSRPTAPWLPHSPTAPRVIA